MNIEKVYVPAVEEFKLHLNKREMQILASALGKVQFTEVEYDLEGHEIYDTEKISNTLYSMYVEATEALGW